LRKNINIKTPIGTELVFELNPTQSEALQAYEDGYKFVCMGGAVRSGKTWLLGLLATLWSLIPGNVGVICRGTYQELHDVIWEETLKKFFFEPLFKGLYTYDKLNHYITLAPELGGACIRLMNLKDPTGKRVNVNKGLMGKGIGWFAIDQSEACWPQAFNTLLHRMSLNSVPFRRGFLNLNPAGRDWNWNYFINPATSRKDSKFIQTKTLDNKEHLPSDYIDSLFAMHKDYVDRYVEGNFTDWQGLIYPMFSEATHVVPPLSDLPSSFKLYLAIDHGLNNPVSIGLYTQLATGEVVRFDEYYQRGKFIPEYFEDIRCICKKWGRTKIDGFCVIDPTYNRRSAETGRDNEIAFRELSDETGFNMVPYKANNDVISGINRVASYLQIDPEKPNPFTKDGKTVSLVKGEFKKVEGSPSFFLTSNCHKAIEELQMYAWKETHDRNLDLEIVNDEKNFREEPNKKNDHTCDEIRYMLMSMPPPRVQHTNITPLRKQNQFRVSPVTGY